MPPYVIFGDVSLRHMASVYPTHEEAFAAIPGVGQQKLADYGEAFCAVVRKHLGVNPMQVFAAARPPASRVAPERRGSRPAAARPAGSPPPSMDPGPVSDTIGETLRVYRRGVADLAALAVARNLAESTVTSHLCNAIAAGRADDIPPESLIFPGLLAGLGELFDAAESIDSLGALKEMAGDRYAYRDLQLFRAFRQAGKV